MFRWLGGLVVSVMVLALAASAFGGPAPAKPEAAKGEAPVALAEKVLLIDDFESGSLKGPREWWTFELARAEAASNKGLTAGDSKIAGLVGNYSLLLSGSAKNWYGGGCGTYIAREGVDLSRYGFFQADIYGNGPGSGSLKVELADDDNSNWQVEQDSSKNYALTKDDKYSYEVKVDWSGWKRVSIPLADFTDENPMVGDDIWNPQPQNGSGGLLQVQFICLGSASDGRINFNVDNVALSTE
ncbi:MAG: hypothetical protein MUC35_01255 [Candidatus Margulisbacteria bacterium]|nr:hypothetical protein [Candidatus Margulisiibacteriota bacterium]